MGFVNGDTSVAQFGGPFGMCADNLGNLYIVDADNNCIRKITSSGIVSTYAGSGIAGFADGTADIAQFNRPADICLDESGNFYVSDFQNQRIRKIDILGNVSTIAGNGIDGYADGISMDAEFSYPRGIVLDSEGNLFISDSWNHRIRKINLAGGVVTTFAGGGINMGVSSIGDLVDANDTSARFYTPSGLTIDFEDNIYVADAYNHRIRKITSGGEVTTIAGSGDIGPGLGGYSAGNALTALLNTPTELFYANDGTIYISDTYNYRVRALKDEMIYDIAGNGQAGYEDGIDSLAKFKYTRGIVLDADGSHLFVCDYTNRRIRKITLNAFTDINSQNITRNSVKIFPNPNPGKCTIEFSESQINITHFEIIDNCGKVIRKQENLSGGKQEVNISNMPPGIYFIKFFTSFSSFSEQMIVF